MVFNDNVEHLQSIEMTLDIKKVEVKEFLKRINEQLKNKISMLKVQC